GGRTTTATPSISEKEPDMANELDPFTAADIDAAIKSTVATLAALRLVRAAITGPDGTADLNAAIAEKQATLADLDADIVAKQTPLATSSRQTQKGTDSHG